MIDHCASLFDWAEFRRTHGVVKLRALLNHNAYLACVAVTSEGRTQEVKVAQT